ncbi:MAG: hypothetical protein WD336_03025, partial [Trueperaceae bacterium]
PLEPASEPSSDGVIRYRGRVAPDGRGGTAFGVRAVPVPPADLPLADGGGPVWANGDPGAAGADAEVEEQEAAAG